MARNFDKLEGSYKLARLKRLERITYILQIVGIIVLFLLLVYFGEPKLNPFFLPLYWPLLVVFIWFLILAIEFFAFRIMEIKNNDSESAKYLMANRSMKKAYTIIVIAGIVLALTVVPFFPKQVENFVSSSGEIVVDNEAKIDFLSRGRFDFVSVEKINVEITSTGDGNQRAQIYVISKENYDKNQTELSLNQAIKFATPDDPFEFEMPDVKFEEYYLWVKSGHNLQIKYEIIKNIPDDRIFLYSVLSLSYLVAHLGWTYSLYPIKKKHSDKAIYD